MRGGGVFDCTDVVSRARGACRANVALGESAPAGTSNETSSKNIQVRAKIGGKKSVPSAELILQMTHSSQQWQAHALRTTKKLPRADDPVQHEFVSLKSLACPRTKCSSPSQSTIMIPPIAERGSGPNHANGSPPDSLGMGSHTKVDHGNPYDQYPDEPRSARRLQPTKTLVSTFRETFSPSGTEAGRRRPPKTAKHAYFRTHPDRHYHTI